MIKYVWVIIFLVGGALAITGYAVIKNKDTSYAPDEIKTSAECQEYFYNKDAKVRVLFFASKETTAKYANYLLAASPYANNKDKISIYYTDSYTPKCEIYKNIALYCQSSEVEKMADNCAAEYAVVFDNKPASIRSSSYKNTLSININHPLNVIMHEFGHTFGRLEDEYVPAKLTDDEKNCRSSCDEFSGKSEGCFEGCSKDNFFRSVDKGVMKTLTANEYGEYNEYLIEQEF